MCAFLIILFSRVWCPARVWLAERVQHLSSSVGNLAKSISRKVTTTWLNVFWCSHGNIINILFGGWSIGLSPYIFTSDGGNLFYFRGYSLMEGFVLPFSPWWGFFSRHRRPSGYDRSTMIGLKWPSVNGPADNDHLLSMTFRLCDWHWNLGSTLGLAGSWLDSWHWLNET